MSNLYDLLSRISNSLAILAQQVKSEAKAGMTSRNKVAENTLLPVLRRTLASPGLQNTNEAAANFPGIDLFDESTGIGVQISSETGASKITETLKTIVDEKLPVEHLIVVLITASPPKYQSKTREIWNALSAGHFDFDSKADIIGFDDLLSKIQGLPIQEVITVADELDLLIQGKRGVDLLPHLEADVRRQLATEIGSAKYIPDVFVENVSTKYDARCFAHPRQFLPHIVEWVHREPFWRINRLASMAGIPPVTIPEAPAFNGQITLPQVVFAARQLASDFRRVDEDLQSSYAKISSRAERPFSVEASWEHLYQEVRYPIADSARSLHYVLEDRLRELECVQRPVFLLTGPAGQGKTNFICDFVDNFLLRHRIPCSYLTARQLSRIPEPDLTETVRKLVFPPSVSSFDEGMRLIGTECVRLNKPFILVIDGLNEHPDLNRFGAQLEFLITQLLRYPHARALLTCRSEFFDQRFGNLTRGEFAENIHLSKAHGRQLDDDEFNELVERYFTFFGVQSELVAERVVNLLRNDMLLLRFFCEAYGTRGRGPEYRQPKISQVFRDEIFGEYLNRKLGSAERLASDLSNQVRPLSRVPGPRRVLTTIADYMIREVQYSDVPAGIIPTELHEALYALLDEELILRRDAGPEVSVLEEAAEVINFTFDELRDYILAQYLLQLHKQDPRQFHTYTEAQGPTDTQSFEGIQRFLFYAARNPQNRDFLNEYEAHPWYAAVYDDEVFNLRPEYLDERDAKAAVEAMSKGGEDAQSVAVGLAVRWDAQEWPVLNLALLLSFAAEADDQFFTEIISPAFGKEDSWYDRPALVEQFCTFVEKRLPEFSPATDSSLDSVFRLLVLLLPVDASYLLESPGVSTFRKVMAAHPEYSVELLESAISDGRSWNQPFVWRLLGESVPYTVEQALAGRKEIYASLPILQQ
jgi:hypothetical protein